MISLGGKTYKRISAKEAANNLTPSIYEKNVDLSSILNVSHRIENAGTYFAEDRFSRTDGRGITIAARVTVSLRAKR
jgi:hypothetical protein